MFDRLRHRFQKIHTMKKTNRSVKGLFPIYKCKYCSCETIEGKDQGKTFYLMD